MNGALNAARQVTYDERAHRPELDGIRGLAILLVLGTHIHRSFMSGGGVAGVTLFFVLSGYLITGILVRAIDDGRFSLRAFYGRRIRRLWPALAVMLLVACAIWAARGELAGHLQDAVIAALQLSTFANAAWHSLGENQWNLDPEP